MSADTLLGPEGLFALLAEHGVAVTTVEHPPLFTVADSKALRGVLPGGHVKNLFLKPEKPGPYLLVVLEEDRQVSVNAIARMLGSGRARFADAAALMAQLGVTPGSVTPFGMVNARPGQVRIAIDRALLEDFPVIQVHPLVNTMTTGIAPAELLRVLRALGHEPEALDLGPLTHPE